MQLLTPGFGLIFWTLLSFIIVFLILKKFAWKPILDSLNQREKGIADSLATAEKIKAEMALLKSENEALLVKAREERAIMTLKQHDLINKFTHKFFRKSIDNDFHINKHSTP